MQKLLILVSFLFPLIVCKENRIVGGEEANIAQHGWQVSLLLFGNHYCGGVIIDKNWILTAAHCIENETNANKRYSVRVGSSTHEKGGKVYKVKETILHPEYDTYTVDFDVALIRLAEPISFTACTVRPIQIVDEGVKTLDGAMLTVTGWGSRTTGGDITTELRSVNVPYINKEKCDEYYSTSNGITDNMICAGYPDGGMDACIGDSGGPLVNEGRVLIGIVSWGNGCAKPKKPGVYTNIAAPKIRQFIKSHTNI
ncbi:trypsin-3-like [Ctenocephalides felis]|uniref:trypsin-3-like n=1 Tax=Ctenocephalides felis TaxID=7515 RepID=UPI000E6E3C0A|nr:trypsin-3-like [Ctenocephalides felis]